MLNVKKAKRKKTGVISKKILSHFLTLPFTKYRMAEHIAKTKKNAQKIKYLGYKKPKENPKNVKIAANITANLENKII